MLPPPDLAWRQAMNNNAGICFLLGITTVVVLVLSVLQIMG